MGPIKSMEEFERRLGKANISYIPRRKDLTKEEFTNDHLFKGAPVILEGWINQWSAVSSLTPKFFKTEYPEVVFPTIVNAPVTGSIGFLSHKDHYHPMRIAEIISLLENPQKSCRVKDIPIQKFPGLEKYCNFEDFMGHHKEKKFTSVWLGGPGTSSTLHWDPWNNFLAQFYGRKFVVLYPPEESKNLYPFDGYVQTSRLDPLSIDYDTYPKYQSVKTLMIGELNPGDLLYFPFAWWHLIRNEEVTIGLNCFFGRLEHSAVLKVAASSGIKQWITILKDFFLLGLFGKEDYPKYIVVGQPTGKHIYRMLTGIIQRRLSMFRKDGSSSAKE